jgi:predicted homoserine dehydrogenase-like protein
MILRPYHLTSLEVPLSAVRSVIHRRADMVPLDRPVAECGAVAKRDLLPGQILGKIGEYDYRGLAMTWHEARHGSCVPLGLAEQGKVKKPIKAGELLTYENLAPDENLIITKIRRELDASDAIFLKS